VVRIVTRSVYSLSLAQLLQRLAVATPEVLLFETLAAIVENV
jgi:hypothetical protein